MPLPTTPMTITLWDFSWYVRSGPGEPFEDLDRCFTEAADRGYDTVRVCAMPFLLFRSGLDASRLRLGPLGGGYAQGVRWYDVQAPVTLDGTAALLQLFRAADRHGFRVVVSSWEYQQSPAFSATGAWHGALRAVDPEDRAVALAHAHADLLDLLDAEGLRHVVAFTELHNEVQAGALAEGLPAGADPVVALRPRLERGLRAFRDRRPDDPCTVNYAGVPVGSLRGVPADVDVLAVHPYVYGVLQELLDTFGIRGPAAGFDEAAARRELLRPDAPPFASWRPPAAEPWRLDATVLGPAEVFVHDWADPGAFDRWLLDRYGAHRLAMDAVLDLWLAAAADLAAERGIPWVAGEGWVGYTPLHGGFEEGPVGAAICRRAVRRAGGLGALGTVVCSNAAPQHPMWADVALQRECTAAFRQARAGAPPAAR